MDPTVLAAIATAVGVVLGGVGQSWINARLKKREVDVLAFERAERIYGNSIERLNRDVADLAKARDTDQSELGSLRVRVRGLETARDRDHRRIDQLIDYVRQLQRMLRANNVEYPPAPAELDLLGGTDPNLPQVT